MAGEEARRQLNKDAASNIEQVLAATPVVLAPIGILRVSQMYSHEPFPCGL